MGTLIEIFRAGGLVMWPLLAMSVVCVAAVLERSVAVLRLSRSPVRRRLGKAARLARERRPADLLELARDDSTAFGRLARDLAAGLQERPVGLTEAEAAELLERERPGLERYRAMLSTIVAAAPLLGILGTVSGIIESFGLLQRSAEVAQDPALAAGGIAEALYTTAFGLVIALVAVFPANGFRASTDRALAEMERLAVAALEG